MRTRFLPTTMKLLINSTAAHFLRAAGRRMHSSQIIAGQPWTPEGIMMSRQKELPTLPVLPLQDLLRRHMEWMKPALTAHEQGEFEKVVQDFGKPGGEGELLHKLLLEKASCTPNWFSGWLVENHLKARVPLTNTSAAMCLMKQTFIMKIDQLRQAAGLAAGALEVKHLIERELLQPEFRGTTPLDMSQYQNIFSAYRAPSKGCDKLEFNPNQKYTEHVLVMHNGQMFTFNACDARGMPHDERRILTQLIRVVEMSPEKDVGVGILTAADRDVWAEAYGRLRQNTQNAASLEVIKKAAVVVCLDGGLVDTEPFEVAWPRQVYRGGPKAEHGANRWWDKPVQVVVGEDGGSALLFDHTVCDGTVMAGITSHCYNYALKAGSFEASDENAEAVPQKLEFVLGPDTLRDIAKATSFQIRYSDDTDRLFYQFSNYGKKFVQSCNMSPEGYVQMAMQLAASRTWGSHFLMFGTTSTRKFLHGRVEIYNTISEESRTFCRVFDHPRSSRAEKEQSLRKAVARAKQNAVLTADGLGVRLPIHAMLRIALENGIPMHPFFKDRLLGGGDIFMNSQANIQCDGTSFADPGLPNMYMTSYNIRPDSFIFGISSSKSFPEKNATKLKDALEEALTDLRDCVTPSC